VAIEVALWRRSPEIIAHLAGCWDAARRPNDRLAGRLEGRPELELPGKTLGELARVPSRAPLDWRYVGLRLSRPRGRPRKVSETKEAIGMSKHYRPWKIDAAQLLPPSVRDYVPKDHPSRFIVALVRERLDLSEIEASYASVFGQPAFQPALMVALLLHSYTRASVPRGALPRRAGSAPTS
jgi:hypothetical protein